MSGIKLKISDNFGPIRSHRHIEIADVVKLKPAVVMRGAAEVRWWTCGLPLRVPAPSQSPYWSRMESQIEGDLARLEQRVQTLVRQFVDLVRIEVLNNKGQFRLFRRFLNYDDWRMPTCQEAAG